MKPLWGEQVTLLKNSLQQLKSATPNLPQAITYQGQTIPIKDIIKSLAQVVNQFEATTTHDLDGVLYAIHSPGVISIIPNVTASVNAFITQSGTSPYGDQLLSHIWSLYSSLSYILPSERTTKSLSPVLYKNSKTQVAELEKINGILEKAYSNLNTHQRIIEKSKTNAIEVLSQIEKDALEASNAKTNAESNVLQSATSKEKLDQLILDVSESKKDSDDLLVKLNEIKEKAEETLASTSQVALANSFKTRKTSLESVQFFWILSFAAGLLCLFAFTFNSIRYSDLYHLPALINKDNGGFDAWGVVLRVLLAGPIVWFTWFAGKQFANNVALIEDYAFKEASALAFVGYKKDMEDDIDMVKLLRESAIRNFAYPPSRLISSSDTTSPMHDLFEKAFQDKGAFDKLLVMLKALRPGKD